MTHDSDHIAQARICLTLAVEHLSHTLAEMTREHPSGAMNPHHVLADDIRERIAGIHGQEAELERLQRNVMPSIAESVTKATFERGSCGHVATRCECDFAADLYFVPREA